MNSGFYDEKAKARNHRRFILRVAVLILFLVTVAIVPMLQLVIGNRSILDTTHKFDRAIVCLADGEIVKGLVERWIDFENSDQIQVTIAGKTYLVHSSNVTLIAE